MYLKYFEFKFNLWQTILVQLIGILKKWDPGPWEDPGCYEHPGPYDDPGNYEDTGTYEDSELFDDQGKNQDLII